MRRYAPRITAAAVVAAAALAPAVLATTGASGTLAGSSWYVAEQSGGYQADSSGGSWHGQGQEPDGSSWY